MEARNPDGDGPAEHRLDLGEMLVRNVPTDLRGRFGGPSEAYGNSIFVFEVEGLCIGHLGHLHHTPTPEQYAAIDTLYFRPERTVLTLLIEMSERANPSDSLGGKSQGAARSSGPLQRELCFLCWRCRSPATWTAPVSSIGTVEGLVPPISAPNIGVGAGSRQALEVAGTTQNG
jgi:hypothetical protein